MSEHEVRWIEEDDCRVCGGRLDLVDEATSVRIGSEIVTVDVRHRKCASCGEVVYAPDELRELQRRAAAVVRARDGFLTPDQIRRIRERLALTQAMFESVLYAGKKSLVRWEGGQVCQSGAADSLLRVVDHYPEVVDFLAELRGVPVEWRANLSSRPISQRGSALVADPAFGRPDVVSMIAFKASRARRKESTVWGVDRHSVPVPRAIDTKIAI